MQPKNIEMHTYPCEMLDLLFIIIIIIIIIIKIGVQWKAEREWYTPYQSEDPSLTIPTYRQREEKVKNRRL